MAERWADTARGVRRDFLTMTVVVVRTCFDPYRDRYVSRWIRPVARWAFRPRRAIEFWSLILAIRST